MRSRLMNRFWSPAPRRGVGTVLLACALLAGCSLPTEYYRESSSAASGTEATRIGRGLAPLFAERRNESGVVPLGNGLDAFVARIAIAVAAEQTIDVQYYLFHDDATGRLITAYLLQAADRGVRVRVLLDDMDMGGRDADLAAIAQHPNISIRLFNPFPTRAMRYLNFVSHFGTVTRRMHNKSFTVDNQVTIVGGRNIGDEYFEAADGMNFGDMDVLAVGPVVRDVSAAFDRYWNSELAFPVAALGVAETPDLLALARVHLGKEIESLPDSEYGLRLQESTLVDQIENGELEFFWGEAQLLYDLPEKVLAEPEDRTTHLGPELGELLSSVQNDLILVSPYFVPGKEGTALLRSMVEKGCRVTVLTNSLAATDVPAVHSGYARYRRSLIEAGVEIYEMPPTISASERDKQRFGSSQASLHAKTLVFDGERVLVGSMNLDPRSSMLNTEMGILIQSSELAGAIAHWRDEQLPQIAWRVQLEPVEEGGARQRLAWISRENGAAVARYDREPESSLWARIQATILGWLPIERQL